MDFNLVLSQATREDDFVNATALCKQFGREYKEFTKLTGTKKLIEKLDTDGKSPHVKVRSGRSFQTFVHPLIAIELASWLSIDFKVVVLETFKRYAEADPTLAVEVIERQTDVASAKLIAARANSKVTRLAYTDELKAHGCNEFGYGSNTNAVYVGLMDQTSKGLQVTLGVKNPRDGMTLTQIAAVQLAEALAVDLINSTEAYGNKQTTACSKTAAESVKEAVTKVHGISTLNPVYDAIPVFDLSAS